MLQSSSYCSVLSEFGLLYVRNTYDTIYTELLFSHEFLFEFTAAAKVAVILILAFQLDYNKCLTCIEDPTW